MSPSKIWDFVFNLIFMLSVSGLAGGQTSMVGLTYCTETSPLDTKYFHPFYESHIHVLGCAARERSTTQPGYQVHVIRINTTSKEVMLHFNENDAASKGLILVLDSFSAVKWRLSFLGESSPAYKRILFLSQNSSVHSSNAHISSYANLEQLKVTRMTPDPQFANVAAVNWGGLTTFSRINGANRISISMPKAETLPSTCLVGDAKSSSSLSSSVLAYLVTKQTMSGCFHPEVAGQSPSDVHVIDLTSADPDAQSFRELNDQEVASNLPAVYLSLSPDQKGSNIDESVSRNLTLILKSQFPVRWYLESWGLAGNLEVISNNGPVENYSLSSWQRLHIVRKTLPEAFEQLWKSIILDTGSTPVSYIKVELANVLSMVIPPRSKRGLSDLYNNKMASAQLVPDNNNLFDGDAEVGHINQEKEAPIRTVQDKTSKEQLRQLEDTFNSYLVKKCSDSQMIIVTLPLAVTDRFNVSEIFFQEQHCKGTKNQTHWILKTQSTSCGSISYFTDNNPVVRNNIFIKFADGTENFGLAVRIPIFCRFQAGFLGFPPNDEDDEAEEDLERIPGDDQDEDDDGNYPTSNDDFKEEVYRMKVLRTSPAPLALLMENPGDTSSVKVGDKIRVETDFETRSFLSLALEQCWLTDGSDLQNGVQVRTDPNDPRWLMWRGCPSNSNITTSLSGNFPTFSFTITEDHHRLKRMYIVCLIGLCSPGDSLGGNIGQCYEPSMCSNVKDTEDHKGPAAQQMSKRGPIFIVDSKDVLESLPTLAPSSAGSIDDWNSQKLAINRNNNNNQTPNVQLESPSLHSSHVVMVGVPAEIAVVIALASFIIGAVLTGLLCCIHHRRSMPKNNFHIRAGRPDDPAEGSELQSMITSQLQQPNGLVTT